MPAIARFGTPRHAARSSVAPASLGPYRFRLFAPTPDDRPRPRRCLFACLLLSAVPVPLIVQKFGGTSVASDDRIRRAAGRAIEARERGFDVVMVVSARGKKTDELLAAAAALCESPPDREMDALLATGEQESAALMAMTLVGLGCPAISLTGGQAGIRTDDSHAKARVAEIDRAKIERHLGEGRVVIVCGFQGVDRDGNTTTLGRGGSDTTATALAAALDADECEIYTDVEGIFTTDPRKVPSARQMPRISYDEMLELASLGAGVMHGRSIEFAKKFGVPLRVRSSLTDGPGTLISEASGDGRPVVGVALVEKESRVSLDNIPDRPGTIAAVFDCMAEARVAIDMVVQNVGIDGQARVSFTVCDDDLASALAAGQAAIERIGSGAVSQRVGLAKVSAVGRGMASQAGVAATLFRALASAGINIEMITTGEIKISALVPQSRATEAVQVIHETFELEKPSEAPLQVVAEGSDSLRKAVESLTDLEDIAVSDVRLDRSQASITLTNVPDEPGVVASVLEAVAEGGVPVDMIVQNAGFEGRANVSLTYPRERSGDCAATLQNLMIGWPEATSASEAAIAKLTVEGVGLRSHTGVGKRLFGAIAAAEANVKMIGTSEINVSAVLRDDDASAAAAQAEAAFGVK